MKQKVHNWIGVISTLALMAPAVSSAKVVTFNFSQAGYYGGGAIAGSFEAEDLNADGWISSFDKEVINFTLSFSGDKYFRDFSHTISELDWLMYNIGSGYMGDEPKEGLATNLYGKGYHFSSGLGPISFVGGVVYDDSSKSGTPEVITVTPVPEPETYAMLLAGLGLLGFSARRRKQGG